MFRAAVPETSINEHSHTGARENHIYLGSGPIGRAQHEVFAKAQPARMERGA